MSIKFSIGIPAYKAMFLDECITSIINQTYTNFELIIVNDASPEDLDTIVSKYNDDRIKYYKNEKNFGAENVIENWNKCLSYASGEYFILMGDDDKLCLNYLKEFDELIEKNPGFNVYHCRSLIIDENSNVSTLTQSWPAHESVIENMWHRINGWRTQFISDFVYKTSFLCDNHGFYKNKLAWASDDITAYIAMKGKGVIHTNNALLNYRRSRINITSSGSVELKLNAVKNEFSWYREFLESYKANTNNDFYLSMTIKNNLSRYEKKKRIETIAYSGFFNGKGFLANLLYWSIRFKKLDISFSEYMYTIIMAIKKMKANIK